MKILPLLCTSVALVLAAPIASASSIFVDFAITSEKLKRDNSGTEQRGENISPFDTYSAGTPVDDDDEVDTAVDTGIDAKANGYWVTITDNQGTLEISDLLRGDDNPPTAYLDGYSGGGTGIYSNGPAGLGVCSTQIRADCGADDNITAYELPEENDFGIEADEVYEVLGFSFDTAYTLHSLTLWDADHDASFDSEDDFLAEFFNGIATFLFSENGTDWFSCALDNIVTGAALSECADNAVNQLATFTGSYDAHQEIYFAYAGTQYYVGGVDMTPVPLPAAGWLLIAGLGGLGFAARKKKA